MKSKQKYLCAIKYQFHLVFLRILMIVILLGLFQFSGFSNKKESTVNCIFALIYNQQFDAAENMLATEKDVLDPFYSIVLNTDLQWWKYSISRSKEDAQSLKISLNNIDNCTESKQGNKINVLIQKSYELRYERKRYNLIGGMFIRSEINQLLSDINSEQIPLSGEQLELFRLYVSMFQYFEFINPFSIFSKPVERLIPLAEIEKYASKNDLILNTLAHYFLGRIYQKVEKEPLKAKVHFEVLSEKFPENKLFKEYMEECTSKL